jgi:hypothetical protein
MYYYINYNNVNINEIKRKYNPSWLTISDNSIYLDDDIILGNIIDTEMFLSDNIVELLKSLIGYMVSKICYNNCILIFPDLDFTLSEEFIYLLELNDIHFNNIIDNKKLLINSGMIGYSSIYSYINIDTLRKYMLSYVINYNRKKLPNSDYDLILSTAIEWSVDVINKLYDYKDITKCKLLVDDLDIKLYNVNYLRISDLRYKIDNETMYCNKYSELLRLNLNKITMENIQNYKLNFNIVKRYNAIIIGIMTDINMVINNCNFIKKPLLVDYNRLIRVNIFHLIKYNMLNKLYILTELFTSWSDNRHKSLLSKYNSLLVYDNKCFTFLIIYRQLLINENNENDYNLLIIYLNSLINKLYNNKHLL